MNAAERAFAVAERPAVGVRAPSVAWCLVVIVAVKAALATVGFDRTWRWVRAAAARGPERTLGDLDTVVAAEYAVAKAAALFPGRAACLERSLALYLELRRRGIAAQFRMGVQMYPFGAHAWIEYNGVAVNDVPEHVARFSPLPFAGSAP